MKKIFNTAAGRFLNTVAAYLLLFGITAVIIATLFGLYWLNHVRFII